MSRSDDRPRDENPYEGVRGFGRLLVEAEEQVNV